jgi:hypothetical protein
MRRVPRTPTPSSSRAQFEGQAPIAEHLATGLTPAELRKLSPVIAALARVVVARELRSRESRG